MIEKSFLCRAWNYLIFSQKNIKKNICNDSIVSTLEAYSVSSWQKYNKNVLF